MEERGRADVPAGKSAPVKNRAVVTKTDAVARAVLIVDSEMVLLSVAISGSISYSPSTPTFTWSWPRVDASPADDSFEMPNKKAKYKATTTLSAAMAADTALAGMSSVSATAYNVLVIAVVVEECEMRSVVCDGNTSRLPTWGDNRTYNKIDGSSDMSGTQCTRDTPSTLPQRF